jgi:hypothetical protein
LSVQFDHLDLLACPRCDDSIAGDIREGVEFDVRLLKQEIASEILDTPKQQRRETT